MFILCIRSPNAKVLAESCKEECKAKKNTFPKMLSYSLICAYWKTKYLDPSIQQFIHPAIYLLPVMQGQVMGDQTSLSLGNSSRGTPRLPKLAKSYNLSTVS